MKPREGRRLGSDPVVLPLPSSRRRRSVRSWAAVPWLLIAVGAQSSVLEAQAQVESPTRPPLGRADSSGIVRPGDIIRLKVWREPEMSGDVAVNEAGVATLPRLGAMQVSELSADSLQRFLVNTYSKDLRDPAIDITVLRRITILGSVRTPNVYQVDPTMTVSDALALAGGAAPDGKQDIVELRRKGIPGTVRLSRGTKLADTPVRSGDELYVPERSWFSRNTGLVLGGVGTLTSILFLVLRR